MKSRKAEVAYPMQVLIQLVLVAFVTVTLLAYVGQLRDNTKFQQQVLSKEAALTTMAAMAAPTTAYSRIIHHKVPMEKFTFLIEDNKVKVGESQIFLSEYYGGGDCKENCNSKGSFIVQKEKDLSLAKKLPVLNKQSCPKVNPSTKSVHIDAGAAQGVNQEPLKQFIQRLVSSPPPAFLGDKTKPRSADQLFKEFDKRINLGYDERFLVSFQFEQQSEPKILIDIMDVQDKDYTQKVTESRALACYVSNELGGDIPIVAVHPYFLPREHPALMLRQKTVAIQVVLPQNYNTQNLEQKIWRGLTNFVSQE